MERQKKIRQLIQLLPVSMPHNLGETGVGSIASLAFPTSLENFEKLKPDARTAAIATIIRVLGIASSYLSLVLPFEMKSLSGKPYIGPWQESNGVMLTEIGPDLKRGMTMLCWNVEALCHSQGVPSNLVLQDELLHNLWQVFHSPSLGRTIRRSLLDAEGRMGRVKPGHRIGPGGYRHEDRLFLEYADSIESIEDSDDELELIGPWKSTTPAKAKKSKNKNQDWDIVSTPQPPAPVDEDDIKHWINSGAGI
mmetsp:Transcript_6753/g.8800  ORF Transcript_6753/g.8800 Transcript_6753/m.8800 type:complete len:251 (-) Transcript_6753:48-800(-)